MSVSTLTRPISVEQVATIIKQMSQVELQRLLYLVPNLEQKKPAKRPTRTKEEIKASVAVVRAEVMEALNYQPIPRDEPFFGRVTLGEYLALPDKEQARLWDEWSMIDFVEPEEVEVSPNALLT